jgi:diguanylate cyclase (GGDEF)-like protein
VVRARIKTQLKIVSQKEEIEFLANHCSLTNLANPKLLSNYFNNLTAPHNQGVENQGKLISMLYMDLNQFKPINDSYGHDAGDLVLQEVAKRLQDTLADKGLVGRLGGDEFLVIVDGYETQEQVRELSNSLKQCVALPIQYNDMLLNVGASIGVAFYPQDGSDYLQLRKVADAKMYEDKAAI